MSTSKKIFSFLSSVLFYSVMAILVVIVFMFLAYFIDQKIGLRNGEKRQPLFGAYIIISNSMVPSINVQDAVVTMRVGQDKIKINDIITFISKEIETKGTPITHRVIGTVDTESGIKYRTKGDHNNTADFALISPKEVIGKVYLRIPLIGYLQIFMTKPIGWLIIVVIPCILIIGNDIRKLIKGSKKNGSKEKIILEDKHTLSSVEQTTQNRFSNEDNIELLLDENNSGNQINNYKHLIENERMFTKEDFDFNHNSRIFNHDSNTDKEIVNSSDNSNNTYRE